MCNKIIENSHVKAVSYLFDLFYLALSLASHITWNAFAVLVATNLWRAASFMKLRVKLCAILVL